MEIRSFPSIELIPNKLKTTSQPRSLSIHKFSVDTLRDYLPFHPKDKVPTNICFHKTSVNIKIRDNRIDYEIPANTTHRMNIVRQHREMKYDQYFLNTVISIKFFYKETFLLLSQLPSKPIKAAIPLPIEAITGHVSFIREDLNSWQLRKYLILLDVMIAMDTKYKHHPTCVIRTALSLHVNDPYDELVGKAILIEISMERHLL